MNIAVGQWNRQARRLNRMAGRRPALTCVRIQYAEYRRRLASCSIVMRHSLLISEGMIGSLFSCVAAYLAEMNFCLK
jgi:hypothetical protein